MLGRLPGMDTSSHLRTASRPASEQVWQAFLAALRELPPDARAILLLHDVLGAGFEDIVPCWARPCHVQATVGAGAEPPARTTCPPGARQPMSAATPRPASDGHDALNASFSTTYAGVLAFIAVASEGSFARAADRLGIGRSAVSRSVQKLESQLGVRLFLRTTRSTTLTREGELFLEGCNPGVTCILQALEEMRDLREARRAGTCASVPATASAGG